MLDVFAIRFLNALAIGLAIVACLALLVGLVALWLAFQEWREHREWVRYCQEAKLRESQRHR